MSGARVGAACSEARELFPAYLEETLSREERSGVREHLAGCDACRAEASATDPALLFAVMPAGEVGGVDTAKILAGVRAGIALKAAEQRIRPGKRDRAPAWRRPAMTAAAAVAAVALSWSLGPRPRVVPVASKPDAPAARESASSSLSTESPLEGPAATLRPASLVPAAADGGLEPAKTKGKLPGDATIYDWNPGGGQPRVVWIVDRSLDI